MILSDDVIDAEIPCLRQLLDVYEFYGAPVVALMEVPKESISAYGVVDAEAGERTTAARTALYRIRNLVEKPKASGGSLQSGHHRPLCAHAGGISIRSRRSSRQSAENSSSPTG